jgi:hypothetical protein
LPSESRFPRVKSMRARLISGCLAVAFAMQLSAQQPPRTAAIDFAAQIQPILESHCFACHAGTQPAAQLRLDVRSLAVKGGVSGPVIVPGNSAESRLMRRVIGRRWRATNAAGRLAS